MKKYRLINCLDSSFSSWIWVMQNVIGLSEEQIEEILKTKNNREEIIRREVI